jgi:pyrroline-5-carboxylate reductase
VIGRIAFVGGGVMAEAIVRGLLAQQLVTAADLIASDPLPERRKLLGELHQIQTTTDNGQAASGAAVVVLAVKPQHMAEALGSLRGRLQPEQLVLSIAAGVTVRTLADGLEHDRIVRVMPNTPAQIGAGMSVWLASAAVTAAQRAHTRAILQTLGRETLVADERFLDMATAINGSGPAFVFLFVEAMIDAGVHIGLSRPLAEELVLQTVLGSTLMARDSGKHPAELKNMVTSPAGTTAAGLLALEAGGFRAAVDHAVVAAYERSKELGR